MSNMSCQFVEVCTVKSETKKTKVGQKALSLVGHILPIFALYSVKVKPKNLYVSTFIFINLTKMKTKKIKLMTKILLFRRIISLFAR